MTDTAGMGTAVGASIVGSRPIIVLRLVRQQISGLKYTLQVTTEMVQT